MMFKIPETINKDELVKKVINYFSRRIFEMVRTALITFIILYIVAVTGCDSLSSFLPSSGSGAGSSEQDDKTCLDIVYKWSEATLSLTENNQRLLGDRLDTDDERLDYEKLYLETQEAYNTLAVDTSAEINAKDDEIKRLNKELEDANKVLSKLTPEMIELLQNLPTEESSG